MIKGVVFDLDSVLINSEIYYFNAFINIMESDGIKVDREDFKKIIGISTDNTMTVIGEYYGKGFEKEDFMKRFNRIYRGENFNYNIIVFPYTKSVLKEIKEAGYKIALASSSSKENIDFVLEQLEIKEYFKFISSGEDFVNTKPNPEIYINTMNKMRLNPSECLAVEDSFYGIKAAKAAGMKVIAKKDRYFGINQENSDFIFDNISIVPKIIKMINAFDNKFDLKIFEYGSSLYLKNLFLRNNCLRKDIGLNIFTEDLEHEKNYIFLGFLDDGQIIASIGISEYEEKNIAMITSVVVDKDYRNNGYGKLLMNYGEYLSKALGYESIFLKARENRIGFYNNLGYSIISSAYNLPPSNLVHFNMIKNI